MGEELDLGCTFWFKKSKFSTLSLNLMEKSNNPVVRTTIKSRNNKNETRFLILVTKRGSLEIAANGWRWTGCTETQ